MNSIGRAIFDGWLASSIGFAVQGNLTKKREMEKSRGMDAKRYSNWLLPWFMVCKM